MIVLTIDYYLFGYLVAWAVYDAEDALQSNNE